MTISFNHLYYKNIMKQIVFLVFLSLFAFSNISYAGGVDKFLAIIKENAGTGDNGMPKDIIVLLKAKDSLILQGRRSPEDVVPMIVSRLNPKWKYSKRGWAYRLALLEVLIGIGNKVPKEYLPMLQDIVNDKNENNQYVKMQAESAIMTINSEQKNSYGSLSFLSEKESGQSINNKLFADLSAVKYRDMKQEMGLENLVKQSRDLPKDVQVKLARIMVKDEDVFAAYQGAIMLHRSGLEDESKNALLQVLEGVYENGDEKSGRIIYSMIHVFEDEFLNDIFIRSHKNMLKNVDDYPDEVVEKVYKSYAIKKGSKIKVTIKEKRQYIKETMRKAIAKMEGGE